MKVELSVGDITEVAADAIGTSTNPRLSLMMGCRSVAMPVFATGHARLKFERSLAAMTEALHASALPVEKVVITIFDEEWADDALRLARNVLPDIKRQRR